MKPWPSLAPTHCKCVLLTCRCDCRGATANLTLSFFLLTTFSGGATSANSGFTGEQGWDHDPDLLDNDYYKQLLNFKQYTLIMEDNKHFPPFPDQFYWEEEVVPGVSGVFMLQADMALAFDMEGYLNPANGDVNCTLVPTDGQTVCPASPLRARAELYRDNNLLWVEAFEAAFIKMINTGCGNSVCSAVNASVPTKAPVPAPTKAPVSSPTKAPTKTPTKTPTKAPVRPPTKAPLAPVNLAVIDMVLYNADTDRPVMSLTANNGTSLSRKALGTSNWNIVAVTNHPDPDPTAGSVKFAYSRDNVATVRWEEVAPWAMMGDDSKGN
jgi:hypothetical protein